MRRAAYSGNMAGAFEAVASTGRQLMPPLMGAAAFVVAEMLRFAYGRIALARLIPTTAFHVTISSSADLRAHNTGAGTSPKQDLEPQSPAPPFADPTPESLSACPLQVKQRPMWL